MKALIMVVAIIMLIVKHKLDVAREYGIPTIDLYNNFPNTKPTFYATNMLNDTHFSAIGNDLVAEIIMRSLLGNGNSGNVDTLPALTKCKWYIL